MELINLKGRRVLITQSGDFMGPALERVFGALGAVVIADRRAPGDAAGLARRVVEDAGVVDVLIAHLAVPAPTTPVGDVGDDEWRQVFGHMVDPLPRLVAALLPHPSVCLRPEGTTGGHAAPDGGEKRLIRQEHPVRSVLSGAQLLQPLLSTGSCRTQFVCFHRY